MAVTTNKALLFLAGGVAAAAVVAYAAGAFDPLLKRAPETIAALPGAGEADPKDARLPEAPAAAPQPSEGEAAAPGEPAPPQAAALPENAPAVIPPSFDVVRVEGDGSIVIAGKAAPNAAVDLLVGSNVIGSATAGAGGDFAVVLNDPLEPGNYQIVMRATTPDNVAAMSVETAVVSVPETPDGQVLALVEEPGKPSQMITLPKPQAPAADVKPPEAAAPAAEAPAAAEPMPEGETQAALPEQAEPAPAPAQPAVAGPTVRVEAVEIDGRKIFVAGSADPGRTVRGYANEILLGDAKASPDGRYLIEADRDLPVGDYIIRVDALEPDGVKVAARAAVPFEREPGQTIAAVAPPAADVPATQPSTTQPPLAAAPATDAQGNPATQAPATREPAEAPQAGGTAPASNQPPAAAAEAPSGEAGASGQPPVSAAEEPSSGQPATTAGAPAASSPDASAAVEQAPMIGKPEADVAAAPSPQDQLPAPPSADGVTETLAPKLQSVDSAIIIRRGDTLWRISRRVYGRGVRYSTIYLANQTQIEDPDRIWPGQVFKVPEKSNDGEADADYTTLGDRLTTVPADGEAATAPAEAQQ
jgi:nucleoid-associated protein YgaU